MSRKVRSPFFSASSENLILENSFFIYAKNCCKCSGFPKSTIISSTNTLWYFDLNFLGGF